MARPGDAKIGVPVGQRRPGPMPASVRDRGPGRVAERGRAHPAGPGGTIQKKAVPDARFLAAGKSDLELRGRNRIAGIGGRRGCMKGSYDNQLEQRHDLALNLNRRHVANDRQNTINPRASQPSLRFFWVSRAAPSGRIPGSRGMPRSPSRPAPMRRDGRPAIGSMIPKDGLALRSPPALGVAILDLRRSFVDGYVKVFMGGPGPQPPAETCPTPSRALRWSSPGRCGRT